jgi:hypothetical protein
MKNSIRTIVLAVTLAVLALPAFAQRGGGGNTGGPMPPTPSTMYFLMNDSCRLVLESKMSADDAAALEAAVADSKSVDQQLQDIRKQMEAAMRAGDKATFEQLQQQAQTLQQQQGTDITAINTILTKYQTDAMATMRDCHPADGGKPQGGDPRGHGHIGPGPRLRFDGNFFIGHDTCRWALEAQMSNDDAQAFETAALALKADEQNMRDLMKQLRDALKAHDSATAASLRQQLQAAQTQLKTDRDAYTQLLTKYADQIGPVMKQCWTPRRPDGHRGPKDGSTTQNLNVQPIFPNPVKLGDAATLNYTLAADAQVNISISTMMGVSQVITNDSEVAGSYSVTINTTGLQPGNYYIRIQAGTDVMTQKLAVVQ